MRELRQIKKSPIEGIDVFLPEDTLDNVQADITGPEGTPFEGGVFRCKIIFGADFPSNPPKGVFLTKIFHPNVSAQGEICVNTLKRDWSPDCGLARILSVIRCLLICPNPESALNEEAGKLLLDDYEDYFKRAKVFTGIYAKPALGPTSTAAAPQSNENMSVPSTPTPTEDGTGSKKRSAAALEDGDVPVNPSSAVAAVDNAPSVGKKKAAGAVTKKKSTLKRL